MILYWDLSSPAAGQLQFSQLPIIVCRNLASIACLTRALSTCTANPPSHNALPVARLKRLGADIPPAWPPAHLCIKRPHNLLLDSRAARQRSLHLCPGRCEACRRGPRQRHLSCVCLGELYSKVGRHATAFIALHHALELASESFLEAQTLDPNHTMAWVGQALIATWKGHHADSRMLFEHAVSLSADVVSQQNHVYLHPR
jgi:hypothetical protein